MAVLVTLLVTFTAIFAHLQLIFTANFVFLYGPFFKYFLDFLKPCTLPLAIAAMMRDSQNHWWPRGLWALQRGSLGDQALPFWAGRNQEGKDQETEESLANDYLKP